MALILTSKETTLPVVAAGFTTLGMEVPRRSDQRFGNPAGFAAAALDRPGPPFY
jgi:hypothetical protein